MNKCEKCIPLLSVKEEDKKRCKKCGCPRHWHDEEGCQFTNHLKSSKSKYFKHDEFMKSKRYNHVCKVKYSQEDMFEYSKSDREQHKRDAERKKELPLNPCCMEIAKQILSKNTMGLCSCGTSPHYKNCALVQMAEKYCGIKYDREKEFKNGTWINDFCHWSGDKGDG